MAPVPDPVRYETENCRQGKAAGDDNIDKGRR